MLSEGRKRKEASCQEYVKDSFASLDLSRVCVGKPDLSGPMKMLHVMLPPRRMSSSPFDLPFSQSWPRCVDS